MPRKLETYLNDRKITRPPSSLFWSRSKGSFAATFLPCSVTSRTERLFNIPRSKMISLHNPFASR